MYILYAVYLHNISKKLIYKSISIFIYLFNICVQYYLYNVNIQNLVYLYCNYGTYFHSNFFSNNFYKLYNIIHKSLYLFNQIKSL